MENLIRSEVATCQPQSLRKKTLSPITPLCILPSFSQNASQLPLLNFFKRGFEIVQTLLETKRNRNETKSRKERKQKRNEKENRNEARKKRKMVLLVFYFFNNDSSRLTLFM